MRLQLPDLTGPLRRQSEQRLADAAQEQRLRQIKDGLSRHENLHDQTAREIETLKALPEKITVVFFAADHGSDHSNRLLLDEEARLIGEKIRASAHQDVLELHARWAARPMDAFQAMNKLKPTIVHLSGHGTTKVGDIMKYIDSSEKPHVSYSVYMERLHPACLGRRRGLRGVSL